MKLWKHRLKTNFKHGLSVFEYFISTHGARKGQADTALKTANSGYLTRRLVDVAQDVVISMADCKTLGFVEVEDLKEGGDTFILGARVYGRLVAHDVKDPISGALVLAGQAVMREELDRISDSAVSKVPIRSTLTCQAKRGVCAVCYGIDLSKGRLVDVGTTVGIIAAQSIGEPGTQLTMRTFHIGGTASVAEQSSFVSKYDGTVQIRNGRAVKNREGQNIVLSRKAKLVVLSPDGRELQRHDVEYGTQLLVEDGQKVTVTTKLAQWDPHNKVLLTERAGKVRLCGSY